jgi:hypothetical protein
VGGGGLFGAGGLVVVGEVIDGVAGLLAAFALLLHLLVRQAGVNQLGPL